jgi:hypothetical protein
MTNRSLYEGTILLLTPNPTEPTPEALPVGVWDPTVHPVLSLEVLLGRTMLLTVARWFVLGARETMDNFIQVRAAWRGGTPYFLVWIFMWWDYRGIL